MKITISDNLYIDDLPRAIVDRVFRDLSAPNPEYVTRARLGKWLGKTPEFLTLVDQRDDEFILPRGYLEQLINLAEGHNPQGLAGIHRRMSTIFEDEYGPLKWRVINGDVYRVMFESTRGDATPEELADNAIQSEAAMMVKHGYAVS
jgi:hypothetical protein